MENLINILANPVVQNLYYAVTVDNGFILGLYKELTNAEHLAKKLMKSGFKCQIKKRYETR